MNDSFNAWLVRGTAIAFVAGYAVRTICEVGWHQHVGHQHADRLWGRRLMQSHALTGCLLLVHVLTAFHCWHSWSIDHALAHTAQRTFDVTGIRTDIGLWSNFLFIVVWWWFLIPLSRWVLAPSRYQRWLNITFQSVVGFFIFNATVVFGPLYWIPISLLFVASIIVLLSRRTAPRS